MKNRIDSFEDKPFTIPVLSAIDTMLKSIDLNSMTQNIEIALTKLARAVKSGGKTLVSEEELESLTDRVIYDSLTLIRDDLLNGRSGGAAQKLVGPNLQINALMGLLVSNATLILYDTYYGLIHEHAAGGQNMAYRMHRRIHDCAMRLVIELKGRDTNMWIPMQDERERVIYYQ